MSNIRNSIKTEVKDLIKTSRKQLQDRFNQHPIKRGINQWASQEFLIICKIILNKKHLNKSVGSKEVITIQIKVDL